MCSRLRALSPMQPIEAFEVNQRCVADTHRKKVNLSLGMYKDENGETWVMPVVRKVELQLGNDLTLQHDYLPVLGLEEFCSASVRFLLGEDNIAITEGRAFGVQTLSGSGSIRVGAELFHKRLQCDTVYFSDPTWCNHQRIFKDVGFSNLREYRYWNAKTRAIDFDGLLEDLSLAPANSVVVLHMCAHNPTGVDPTQEQWRKIADVMELVFPMSPSTTSTGLGVVLSTLPETTRLLDERVGNLTLVLKDAALVPAVKSHLTWIINDLYFNPPAHGARIVARILNDEQLFEEWREDIKMMSARVIQMREALRAELIRLNTPGNWDHIVKQIGLFSYTGLTARQVEHLVQEYHIYLLKSGRINICGLNPGNVANVAGAINDAVTKFPAEE